jgi:hypothetical protein
MESPTCPGPCADKAKLPKLVQVFGKALQESLAIPYSSPCYPRVLSSGSSDRVEYSFDPESREGLHRCLRGHADYENVAPLVIRAVAEAIEGLAEREHDPERIKQFRAIRPQKRKKEK